MIPTKICLIQFWRNAYYLFCCFNFMIVLIVILTPLWLWNNFKNEPIFMGLWLKCDNSGCHKVSLPDASPEMLLVVKSLSVLACSSCLISLILSRDYLGRFFDTTISRGLISSIANFLAGTFLLVALLITDFKIRAQFSTENQSLSPSFGFYVGCIACLLAFFLGIVSLVNHIGSIGGATKWRLEPEDTEKIEA